MAEQHRLTAGSAEDLLKAFLRVGLPKPPSTPSQNEDDRGEPQQPPYASPQRPLQIGPLQEEAEATVVDYDSYFQEIFCFSSVNNRPEPNELIREYIQALCTHQPSKLHTGTLRSPMSSIPSGPWTIAFAPAIFHPSNAWIIAFAAPQDSEFVWFFWPERGGTENQVLQFFAQLREEGKLRAEEPMKVGSENHKLFHEMVQQAVWADQNQDALGMDWRSGEFRTVQ